jgi:hypothetical protein
MTDDLPSGSQFPDLLKARLGLKLDDFVKGILNDDKEFFQLAQDKKQELRRQKSIDHKSFIQSQATAIERGNANACDARHNHEKLAAKQAAQVVPTVIPGVAKKSPLTKGKTTTKMPKTRSATPTRGARARPPSIARFNVNQAISPATDRKPHFIQPIEANNSPEKSKRNLTQFDRAQRGERGTSVGDRAIVFSANGTPHHGDSYLDRNVAENLSANQATSNAPISKIPDKIEVGKPISANPLQQQPRANVAPKSDTTTNLVVLGTVAAAVTAVLFLFQHVLIFVQMILQVSSVTSTITNIAGSFVAILNNLGSLFGLGEGLIDPLSKTFDSMLNNVFGKDKVDYVKYQFAKISAVYVAGKNIYDKVASSNNSLGKVTEDNANNTSKIGNALKSMGMMLSGQGWMNEDNKVNPTVAGVGGKLENISGLASSLSEITNDVQSAKEELESLDKAQAEKEKEAKEGEAKASEKNEDKEIPDLERLGGVT